MRNVNEGSMTYSRASSPVGALSGQDSYLPCSASRVSEKWPHMQSRLEKRSCWAEFEVPREWTWSTPLVGRFQTSTQFCQERTAPRYRSVVVQHSEGYQAVGSRQFQIQAVNSLEDVYRESDSGPGQVALRFWGWFLDFLFVNISTSRQVRNVGFRQFWCGLIVREKTLKMRCVVIY